MHESWTIQTVNITVKTVTYTLILRHSVTVHYQVIHAAMLGIDTLSTREVRERKDNPGTERRRCRKAFRLGNSEISISTFSTEVCLLAGSLIM